MTVYYLSSVDGDNASDGLSWANAFLTFEYAVETASAAASGPHTLYVDSAHSASLTADTTVLAAADFRIVCVNRSGGDAPTTGAVVGVQATNYNLLFGGAFEVYVYGMEFRNGTGSTSKSVTLGYTDGGQFEFENCKFTVSGTNTGAYIQIGGGGSGGQNNFNRLINCTIKFAATAQGIYLYQSGEAIGLTVDSAGSVPSTLFKGVNAGGNWSIVGSDLSHVTGTLVPDMAAGGTVRYEFRQCKLGTGVAPLAAPSLVLNRGQTTVTMYDCNSGDNHYGFYHSDAFGTTVSVGSGEAGAIYATAGATTAGTNVSYKVVTRANNCSYYTPYVGPWIAKPHTGTTAITPSFEILRDGSATAYQDDEVWGEWQYKGTSGSVLLTTVSDRMALLGTPANQTTGALAAGDWTGENATAWFGKLAPASTITPAESGYIYGRVVVGEPDITLYYDPQIRIA